MAVLFTILGIEFAVLLVLSIIDSIINKDDKVDMSYLEDC